MSVENRKVQLGFEVNANSAKEGFSDVKEAARDMAQSVQQSGQQAGAGVDAVGAGAGKASQQLTRSERSMVSSIQRTTAAMKAGGKVGADYYETLAKQRGISSEVLAPYLAQLREAERVQGVADKSLNTMGLSAKQTTAALRQVPMQFTDIAVALQGGQQPLTVLLQQGGQLKDMFGGIGPAARALGGYVAGLINPFTLLAAAAGITYVAFSQGQKETDAYSRALVMTGNAAGATTGELALMAERLKDVAGTEGRAASILAELASTGEVGAEQLEKFTTVAVQLESKVGIPVSETVKRLAELGKSPVEASLKLNEQYRYLTEEVYNHIKSLQEQGRESEAAAAAQSAFSDAMSQRAKEVEQNLGLLEKAWKGVKSMASSAWDAMLDIGRAVSPEEALQRQIKAVEVLEQRYAEMSARGRGRADLAAQLAAAQARLQQMRGETDEIKRQASAVAQKNEQDQAAVKWAQEGEKFLDKRQKLESDIARVRQLGLEAGRSEAEIAQRVNQLRAEYAKSAGTEKEYERQQKAIEQQIANLRLQAATFGMSEEAILDYKLALDGATASQREQARGLQQQIEGNKLIAEAWSYVESSEEAALKRGQDLILSNHASAESYRNMIDPMRAVQKEMARIDELVSAGALGDAEGEIAKKKIVEAYKKAHDEGTKIYENLVENVQRATGDGLYKAVKGSFDNIGDAFLDLLLRMATDAAAANITKAMFGGDSGGGWLGTIANFFAGGLTANALGGVYDSPSLSQYRNQVHDKPKFFAFAKGGLPNAGVFAEAGEEAIMPLTRTRDGNLGVRAVGERGGSMNVSVAVDAKGTKVQGDGMQANRLGQMVGDAVYAILERERRPGGMFAGGAY
jgi:phage-related minor tail protein/predicted small metal-binding protein